MVGPLTVRLVVNDHVLDARKFGEDGEYRYSRPIPPDWLGKGDSAEVGLDIDPVFVSPGDGVKLGVLLMEIGLKPADGR